MVMTERERFLATVNFEPTDRPLRWESIGFWDETIKRWHGEGLSADITDEVSMYFHDGFDLQVPLIIGSHEHPGYEPLFEEEFIAEDERYIIKRDYTGTKVKVFADGASAMPAFLESPVKNRRDWEEIKWRLDPESPDRREKWEPFIDLAQQQPWPFIVYATGLFGTLRHLFGFENLMYGYFEQPALIHDISTHWVKLWKGILAAVAGQKLPDCVYLWEDMCGRNGPLISPKMFDVFMTPYYLELIDFLRADLQIPVVGVDTDGDCLKIIPHFVRCGVNLIWPFEVRAGMDVLKVREQWPDQFAIWGGIDKTVLAKGKKEIETEVMRVVPVMLKKQGYIPSLDHCVPPDVPYENWNYYRDLVREVGS
jgi:uroporphyrinogen-III decarboxylase